jgi:alpha-L-rhamnosidase
LASGTPTVELVRIEHRRISDGLGIGVARPRLSWITATDTPAWVQASYEVELADELEGTRVRSDRIESPESVLVPWPGPALSSRQQFSVRVRVWGEDGERSEWSEATRLETGLLAAEEWTARFVTPETSGESLPLLRKEFELDAPIVHARLYVSALGLYEIELGGRRVGDHVLAPGWTSYDHRLRYETFDVTDLVRPGPNAIGALLADGWYRGRLGWNESRPDKIWGDRLALLAQLEAVGADGATRVIATDATWRCAAGPIIASSIYDGESYDGRLERPGWSTPGHDDTSWSAVSVLERNLSTLVARTGPPVRRTETAAPVRVEHAPSGRAIVDFGQNLVGRVRLTVTGPRDTTITLRHGEALVDGELHTENLGTAAQTDRYTLTGSAIESWEPRFTSHGFRYIEVDAWPGELSAGDVQAVVCHTDMERTGWFECSDERVNRLHENIVWSMRGNFVDVPTDCPQREERLGWTGDICIFGPTGCFLYDTAGLLVSWLADLAAEQREDGSISFVVPDIFGTGKGNATAAWGDVTVVLPSVLYERYGDLGVLGDQYASMKAFVEHIVEQQGPRRIWEAPKQFGDWCAPGAPPGDEAGGPTDRHLLANAWYSRSFDLLSRAADALGDTDDAGGYRAIAARARAAFAAEYVTPSGRLKSDTQAAYATAIRFGLLAEPSQRAHAGRRLTELVEAAGDKLTTGFVGTPLVCDALCDSGNAAAAYRLLMQEECPSWLYPVLHGATTVWEAWEAILPDGRPNPTDAVSLNHYAFGAVGDWLHRVVGGLAPAAPGYRHVLIAPTPGGGLTWATCRHRTPYGIAESAWRLDGDEIEMTATVPPNTTATVILPGADGQSIEIGSGSHHWRYRMDPTPTTTEAVRQ